MGPKWYSGVGLKLRCKCIREILPLYLNTLTQQVGFQGHGWVIMIYIYLSTPKVPAYSDGSSFPHINRYYQSTFLVDKIRFVTDKY